MGSIRPRWRPFAVAMLGVLMGVSAFAPLAAIAQTSPVAEARALYEQAQFDEAINLLRDALSTGRAAGADALAAREMIARCLVRKGNRIEAKEAFKGLLHLNPSYRPASGALPPDEMEVYELARSEFTAEQIEAGERVPASLAFHYGIGSGDNSDLAEIAAAGGGDDAYDVDPSFGGAVRFPVTPRWSLEIEMQRFHATNADTFPGDNQALYEISALPLTLSLYYAAITNPKWRINVFGGVGSLLAATSSIRFNLGTVTLSVSDQTNGIYGHGGLEGEYLVHPRFAAYGRVLGRVATASNVYKDNELEAYGTAPLKDRDVSFSGFGAHVGLRAYIGY
jgi:hypothetical protein